MESIPNPAPKYGEGRGSSVIVRILGVFAFILILGIGIWGSLAVAKSIPSAFSNLAASVVSLTGVFVSSDEALELAAPTTVASGQTFTMSWTRKNDTKSEGSYTFRYDCADGVFFVSPAPNGAAQTAYCNVPFNFVNTNNAITLTAVAPKNTENKIPLFITFTPNGASKATLNSKTVVTVINGQAGTATSTPPTNPPVVTPPVVTPPVVTPPIVTPPVVTPTGLPDLAVSVIEVGVQDKTTGAFYPVPNPSRSQRIAIRFSIQNVGTNVAPTFGFTAVLPSSPTRYFTSPTQSALRPGERIEFTLAFDTFNPATPDGVATIYADSDNHITESNEANNTVNYTIHTVQ